MNLKDKSGSKSRLNFPKCVFTGTARSGTRFTASFLKKIGVKAGHEAFFRFIPEYENFAFKCEPNLEVDVSWHATAFLLHSRDFVAGPVIHQVRHPLMVINSVLKMNWLVPNPAPPPMRRFHRDFIYDVIGDEGDPILNAVKYWTEWNLLAQRLAQYSVRIEDHERFCSIIKDQFDILLGLEQMMDLCGEMSKQRINSKSSPRSEFFDLDSIPDSVLKTNMMNLAADYGYEF